jgi:L-asparaginase
VSSPKVPTILQKSQPFFALERKGIPEVVISGVYAAIEGSGPAEGDRCHIILRSLLKPWQFLGLDVGDDDSMWAMGLSSHSAQLNHIQELKKLCSTIGASESDLICPRSFPMDNHRAALAKEQGENPTRINHPCSGKHLLYLAACKKYGYSFEQYWTDQHPVHKHITSFIGSRLSEKPKWMVDSCGLPTICISSFELMRLWEELSSSLEDKFQRLRSLMTQNAWMIGGSKRLDTELMENGGGRIIAKEGADGLLIVSSVPIAQEPAAVFFIKLASGYQQTHLALALWSVLANRRGLNEPFLMIRDFLRSRLETWVPTDQGLHLIRKY